jgi:DNA polymerase III subunit gamma/tau
MNLNQIYRPKVFGEVIGQSDIVSILSSSIKKGTLSNQILLSGSSGIGKTTIARIIASSLLCNLEIKERNSSDPCLRCNSCKLFFENTHPDYMEVDAASHGGKDEMVEISKKTLLSGLISKKRVFVIDEAHAITSSGGQAFLKTLEEPKEDVIFILCTTDPEKLLITNRSRCLEFTLRYPNTDEISDFVVATFKKLEKNISKNLALLIASNIERGLGVRGLVNTISIISSISENEIIEETVNLVMKIENNKSIYTEIEKILSGTSSLTEITNLVSQNDEVMIKKLFMSIMITKIEESESDQSIYYFNIYKESLDKKFDIYWLYYIQCSIKLIK